MPSNDFPERLRALRDAKDAGLGTEGFLLDQPDRDLLTEAAEAIEEAGRREGELRRALVTAWKKWLPWAARARRRSG